MKWSISDLNYLFFVHPQTDRLSAFKRKLHVLKTICIFFIRNKINVGKDDFYGIGSSGEDRLLFIEIAHKRIPHIADFFRVLAIERICCKRVLEMLIFKIQRASLLFSSLLESSAVIVSLSVSVFQVCMARSPFSKMNKFSSNYSFFTLWCGFTIVCPTLKNCW